MNARLALPLLAAALLSACSSDLNVQPIFPAEASLKGDSDYDKGFKYANGIGVPRDYAKALLAYRKAADGGDALAMNNIGVMYLEGRGVGASVDSAVSWFQSAGAKGSSSGRYNLGLLYEAGYGFAASPEAAAFHYRAAAEMGHAQAQRRLAAMLEGGRGIPADPAESRRLMQMSASRGDANAPYVNVANGGATKVAALIAVENCRCQGEADQAMAGRGFTSLSVMSAEGDPSARYNLAVRLLNGDGSVQDPAEAARLFTLSARDGYAPAQRQIAQMHMRGQSVARSKVIAHAWLNLASRDTGTEGSAASAEMDVLERSMSTYEVAEAQELARKYAKKGR